MIKIIVYKLTYNKFKYFVSFRNQIRFVKSIKKKFSKRTIGVLIIVLLVTEIVFNILIDGRNFNKHIIKFVIIFKELNGYYTTFKKLLV